MRLASFIFAVFSLVLVMTAPGIAGVLPQTAASPQSARTDGRRIAVLVVDGCHTTGILDDNCDYDNTTTRPYLINALDKSLAKLGFVVVDSTAPVDWRLQVTITEIGSNNVDPTGFLCGDLCNLTAEATASANYQITSPTGRKGAVVPVHSTADGTLDGLQKLASVMASAVADSAGSSGSSFVTPTNGDTSAEQTPAVSQPRPKCTGSLFSCMGQSAEGQ